MKTITEIFLNTVQNFPQKDALIYKKGHHFEKVSYQKLKDSVFRLGAALEEMGVKKGDKVIIISKNRPEWIMSDLAVLLLGAINVPIHQVLSPKQIKDIVDEINPKAIFICTEETAEKLAKTDVLKNYPTVSFENLKEKFPNVLYFKELLEKTESKERKNISKEDDIASVIYTSGTTGKFSGVLLTHKNFSSNISDLNEAVEVTEKDKFLSILPLSHVFERTVGYYVPLSKGAAISYIEDPTQLSEIAQEEKPTIIIAVPRLYEKIYDKILLGAKESPIKEKLFNLALVFGRKYNIEKNEAFKIPYKISDKIVFSKVKKKFGGKIRFFVSGAASLPMEISEFFHSMGWNILEGYGLTETSPVLTCGTLESYKFGSAGRALKSVSLKIDKEGMILAKGPNVTTGYLNSSKNDGTFTKDGYFITGDLGHLDKDGFLFISGRKKEILVLSTGKNVSPVLVEEVLESDPYVLQAFVVGDKKKHVAAILVPDFESLKEKFPDYSEKEILTKEDVKEFLSSEIAEIMPSLAEFERIRRFSLIEEPFTVENGLLTPTLKLRRHLIMEKYREEIEKLYV